VVTMCWCGIIELLTMATSLLSVRRVSMSNRWCLVELQVSRTIIRTEVKHILSRLSDLAVTGEG